MFGKKIVISDPLLYRRRIERWENFRVTQVYTLKCQKMIYNDSLYSCHKLKDRQTDGCMHACIFSEFKDCSFN